MGIVPAVDNPDEGMSCVLCNLVFDSTKNLNSHREHKDHSYTIKVLFTKYVFSYSLAFKLWVLHINIGWFEENKIKVDSARDRA